MIIMINPPLRRWDSLMAPRVSTNRRYRDGAAKGIKPSNINTSDTATKRSRHSTGYD